MRLETDRALLPAGAPATRYLTIRVTAPTSTRTHDRQPAHVGLVLDRSGSMGGSKLDLARAAVTHAIALLNDRDRLALVVYDNEIDTLLASTPASEEAKALATRRLADVDARGNTDLSGGWFRGIKEIEEVEKSASHDGPRKVLLLTDGLANTGITDADELARSASAFRAKGIATSTFGLGADFDETLLSRIATDGGGHFYFIEHPAQIADLFASELGETLDIVARDVRVHLRRGDGVGIQVLNDFPCDVDADGVSVRLGDLTSAQELTIVVAVHCEGRAVKEEASINVRMLDRDDVFHSSPMPVEWRAVSAADDAAQPVASGVLVEAARLYAARARLAALDANRRGDFTNANRLLKECAKFIRAMAPGVAELSRIAAELRSEASTMDRVMAPMAMKSAHFASVNETRSRDYGGKARRTS